MTKTKGQGPKRSGILLHISALPSNFGIGDFGPGAYAFADFLHECGQSVWQILPLNPTSSGVYYSPYSSFSAYALNPLLISPEKLAEKGLVMAGEIRPLPLNKEKVDFAAVTVYKENLFARAFETFQQRADQKAFDKFLTKHAWWLDDFAQFKVLNDCFPHGTWDGWPAEFRDRDPKALADFSKRYAKLILKEKFIQFVAFEQWQELADYCQKKGISFLGDLPLYLSFHSVDVWSHRKNFKLDSQGKMTHVAGVPPDYFCAEGQLWGNPLYDWEALAKSDFKLWRVRLQHNLQLFSMVRIDHFRGLVAYWAVPVADKNAVNGAWCEVPVDDLLDSLQAGVGNLHEKVLAEDLGIITDDVKAVMKAHHLPGMKVLLFAFSNENDDNPYLPKNIGYDSVTYTGTHDNNTIQGWWKKEAQEHEKSIFAKYANIEGQPGDDIHWDLISLAMSLESRLVILPLQDVLGLDETARFNVPGVAEGNWAWRADPAMCTSDIKKRLHDLTVQSGRA